MSMLSEQCEMLRDRADELRMLAGGMDAPYIIPSTKETMALAMQSAASEMREAADTIESLRDRLQAVNDGCEYCKGGDGFDGQKVMMSNHGWQTINCCPNCGKRCVHRG